MSLPKDIYDFKTSGTFVNPEIIERVWLEIREKLSVGYPRASKVIMPKITCCMQYHVKYDRSVKRLLASGHLLLDTEKEYGDKVFSKSSACVFSSQTDSSEAEWFILKCNGRFSLEHDLKHELLHVWEKLLQMDWGTLTNLSEWRQKLTITKHFHFVICFI
jgi:hypothetical protein